MKNLVLLSLFLLSFVFSVSAQNSTTTTNNNATAKTKKTPVEKATMFSNKMKTDLGLTDDQTQKLNAAKLDQLTQREAIKTKYNNDNKAGETEFRANNDKFKTAMKSILTPDQLAKLEAAKKNAKGGNGSNSTPATDDNE
jgi:protein CpxP